MKNIDNTSIIKKIDSLWTKKKPLPWTKEAWENYKDGVHGAVQRIPNLGELKPRDLLSLSRVLDDLADEWKEKCRNLHDLEMDFDAEENWYVVMGVNDVKEVLIDALDQYLAQDE